MSKVFELLWILFLVICEFGLWTLLMPGTFWERAATFGIVVICLVLFILFVHIWRTKWKDNE